MSTHARWVRISHWVAAASLLTLAFSGIEILMVHPRLYWGDAGNDLTPALVELPISRNYRHGGWDDRSSLSPDRAGPVSASRTYEIFNQNGWGRSLHFLAAWWLAVPGVIYVLIGIGDGHFRKNFWPWSHAADGPRYGFLQKCTYSIVVFVAAPLMVATGLTMSPAVTAAAPLLLRIFGGYQSARTIHFFTFSAFLVFVVGHVTMVARSGFSRQLRAMTVGD
jgi:hypothetical protein